MLQLGQQLITYQILLVLIIQSNILYVNQLQLWLYMSAIIVLIYEYTFGVGDGHEDDDGNMELDIGDLGLGVMCCW